MVWIKIAVTTKIPVVKATVNKPGAYFKYFVYKLQQTNLQTHFFLLFYPGLSDVKPLTNKR